MSEQSRLVMNPRPLAARDLRQAEITLLIRMWASGFIAGVICYNLMS